MACGDGASTLGGPPDATPSVSEPAKPVTEEPETSPFAWEECSLENALRRAKPDTRFAQLGRRLSAR